MEKGVWYVLREDMMLLQEEEFWEGEAPDEEILVREYDFVPANEVRNASYYPNEYHARKAIERVRKALRDQRSMIPICFPKD